MINSEPSGAEVYVNNEYVGNAPLDLRLQSNHSYTIEFRKKGYESRSVHVSSSVNAGWIVIDCLFGLLPVIVDAATGSWYKLDQDNVNAVLHRQQESR